MSVLHVCEQCGHVAFEMDAVPRRHYCDPESPDSAAMKRIRVQGVDATDSQELGRRCREPSGPFVEESDV